MHGNQREKEEMEKQTNEKKQQQPATATTTTHKKNNQIVNLLTKHNTGERPVNSNFIKFLPWVDS